MPYQVSVFVENKKGKIERISSALKEKNVNIRAITISDAGDYGIIKLLLDNPELGCEALTEAGLTATLKEVLAIKINDKPGGLHAITETLSQNDISVDDAYGFILNSGKDSVLVFQVENRAEAENLLQKAGLTVMSEKELYLL